LISPSKVVSKLPMLVSVQVPMGVDVGMVGVSVGVEVGTVGVIVGVSLGVGEGPKVGEFVGVGV
jgi:hypothetical protein